MNLFPKRLLLIFVLQGSLVLFSNAQAIQFEWVKTLGSPTNSEHGMAMVLDSNKSVIVTGGFYNTIDFDAGPSVLNLTSNGNQDIYVTEYDTRGNFMWAKQIGGIFDDLVKDIKIDQQGNLFVLGIFQATVDFDPGPGVNNITTSSAKSFILKLDNNGNFIWVKEMPYGAVKLEIDAADNIILGGSFGGSRDFDPGPGTYMATANSGGDDMYVVKLDNSGNFTWMSQLKNMGGSEHQQWALRTDPANNIFFAGNFTLSMDFDPGTPVAGLTSLGSDDAFLLKLNSQGNFVWVKQFGAADGDKIFGIEVDNDGSVFSTGFFHGTADFDPGPGSYPLSATGSFRCCFISKLDANGNLVYAKNFQSGESFGQALAIDSSNNLYIAGGFHGTTDFDPGPATYNIPNGQLFTLKLDPDGNFNWAAGYTPPGNAYFESIYSAIKVDILKNVYFTGSFPGTVDFDPNATLYNVASTGGWDIYIHKLSQCKSSQHVITAEACSNYSLNNITYASSGVYYQTLVNNVGCDSIIQLNLSIGNKFNQLAVTACDSYIWNGTPLTSNGIYKDTFSLANGCDSIVQLTLTITKILTSADQTSCGSYVWNGTTLTNSGIYRDTFRLASGCDSIVTLNLTVKNKPAPYLGKDSSICKGDTINFSPGVFTDYLWSNNTTGNTLAVSDTGTYWVRVTGADNCTATDTILITSSNQCIEDCKLSVQIKLYPSPAHTFLIVNKKPTNCEVRMNLYNSIGQLIAKDKIIADGLNNIPVEILSAGVYFCTFHSGGKILFTEKVLKL